MLLCYKAKTSNIKLIKNIKILNILVNFYCFIAHSYVTKRNIFNDDKSFWNNKWLMIEKSPSISQKDYKNIIDTFSNGCITE